MKHPFFSICSITVFATVAALNDTALSSSRADHFLGGFQNEFKDLMEYDSYSFDDVGMNQEVREVSLYDALSLTLTLSLSLSAIPAA